MLANQAARRLAPAAPVFAGKAGSYDERGQDRRYQANFTALTGLRETRLTTTKLTRPMARL